jgi:hypothetical protein
MAGCSKASNSRIYEYNQIVNYIGPAGAQVFLTKI